jgi:hypothetical protein
MLVGIIVNLTEFCRLGICGPGHPSQFFEHSKIILKGDRGQGLVLIFNPNILLSFHRLMESIAPSPARHEPSGEFIDNDHLTLFNHIINIPFEKGVSL